MSPADQSDRCDGVGVTTYDSKVTVVHRAIGWTIETIRAAS